MRYSQRRSRRGRKIISVVLIVFSVTIIGGALATWRIYDQNLDPVSSAEQGQAFTVAPGASVQGIGNSLEQAGLIRSSWAFEWYVRIEGAREFLKAGIYNLRPNMSVPQIVAILTQGEISTDLVTILPGKNLEEIKTALIDQYGFDAANVEAALSPDLYVDHPVLAEKPAGVSLEGFLYPESFHRTVNTKVEDIIRASLDEMHEALTPELKNSIVKQGFTVYEGINLASIIENEVGTPDDRKTVGQVFLTRLRNNIALESNATAPYGALLAGEPYSESFTSPYNTYQNPGLPPTPVSNVSLSSLAAVAYPSQTDYIYFFSGDDGRTHFSHTLAEHRALIEQYCKKCQKRRY